MAQLTKQEKLELKKAKKAAKKQQKREKRAAFAEDFKKFLFRGNVIDLAVGVVVGGAFSKIVTSFTNGIVMPLVGKLMGKVSLADLKYVLTPATYVIDETTGLPTDVVQEPEVAILYGQFLQNIVDFLLIAACIFLAVRIINSINNRIKASRQAMLDRINAEELAAQAAKKAEEEAAAAAQAAIEAEAKAKAEAELKAKEEAVWQTQQQTLAVLTELKGLLERNAK